MKSGKCESGMVDLSGVDRKLGRAAEHLESFKTEERRWIAAQREFVVVRPRPHAEGRSDALSGLLHFELVVENVVPLPRRLPMLVGDCVGNLRASLDHLAYQLVLGNGGTPTTNTRFPISRSGSKKPVNIHGGIDTRALEVVNAIQPPGDDHPLAVLRELSNSDKHRLPVLVAEACANSRLWIGLGGVGSGPASVDGRSTARPLEPGTMLVGGGVPPASFQRYPYVYGETDLRIAFGTTEVSRMRPVADVLDEMTEAVRSVTDALRIFTLPAAYHRSVETELPLDPTIIARVRAIREACGGTWPWKEGPLGIERDENYYKAALDDPHLKLLGGHL